MSNQCIKIKERCKLIKVGEQQGLIIDQGQIDRIGILANRYMIDKKFINYNEAIDHILNRMIIDIDDRYDAETEWIWSGQKVL